MADHRLIAAYRENLLTRLPAGIAEEVSDGLTDAQEKYLRRGLSPDQAAAAAVAEFGSAGTVAEAFRRTCPVLRLARILIVTGPVVGGSWAAALITARAWDWPVPLAVKALAGLVLAASIVMLATSALTRRYQSLVHAGVAGCIGIAILDVTVTSTAISLAASTGWLLMIAVSVSTIRLTFVARVLRLGLARRAT